MSLIFRTVDEQHPVDLEQFNVLMDNLTNRAYDQTLLQSRIREANHNPDKYLLVAEDEDTHTLCGSVLGICFGDFCEGCDGVMVIENVVTHPDYRGKGVASAMLEHIEDWGREKRAVYAILCSANHRLEAHKLYEKVGYSNVKGYKKYL